MCGIVGFTGTPDVDLLRTMCHAIIHRGPDDEGYYEDPHVSLGVRRLAIVDLESGLQPLCNETGDIWTVFNGEIYNHFVLRRELILSGHVFRTDHSDTEVIVHLYEEDGEQWVTRVNGMFGLAIWDKREEKLLLYRDRIGKKPLYYALKNAQLVFGSEIKAMLKHPAISAELNYKALYRYFGLKNISAPDTAFTDINQLLPGHCLVWKGGKIKIRPYWNLDFSNPLTDISEEEACQRLFDLFEDSVRMRMQCDVPFGAYLSGGVDSSSVVAMMSRHHSKPIKTFCLGYEDKAEGQFLGKAEDIVYAREISQRLGTEHYEYIIGAQQFAAQMSKVLHAFDEPFSGTISTFFLSILMNKHVKVALSGDGADELFGSYFAHRLAFPIDNLLGMRRRGINNWDDLAGADREAIRPFDTSEQFRFLQTIASCNIAEWRDRLCVFSSAERRRLLSEEFLHAAGNPDTDSLYQGLEAELTARDMLNKSLEIDQQELLPNQVLPFVDRLSMAHSVEVRVPYLDYRIIEFSNRLPGKFKIKNGIVKYIHKRAMEKLLPRDLVQRKKEGFVQPIYSWMHGALRGWVEQHLDSLRGEIFDLSYVKNLKTRFWTGDQRVNARIWNLVCFAIWYEERPS